MKKALLYLLLFAYTTFVCKPLLPFITDTIAHIFWYSEHVATVHYENGKYHVHLENIDAAKKSQSEKNTPAKYNEPSGFYIAAQEEEYKTNICIASNVLFHFNEPALLNGFTGLLVPPPKI